MGCMSDVSMRDLDLPSRIISRRQMVTVSLT
jgi:hypothetical protein